MRVGTFAASGAAAVSGPALLLRVPKRLALGAPSHRRGIRLYTVRRGAQPDLFRQLGCLEADGGLVLSVVESGDSGYPVAPGIKILLYKPQFLAPYGDGSYNSLNQDV